MNLRRCLRDWVRESDAFLESVEPATVRATIEIGLLNEHAEDWWPVSKAANEGPTPPSIPHADVVACLN